MSDQDVLLVGPSGTPIEDPPGRDIFEVMGISPPGDGASVAVMVELLKPVSPYGAPYRLRDEMAPFDVEDYGQRHGAGRYRFRIRNPDGRWGKQCEAILHGPPRWERKWAEEYVDQDAHVPTRRTTAPTESPMFGHVLAMQAEQSKMLLGVMTELMKGAAKGAAPVDPFGAASSVFGLVEKVRALAGDRADPEGWNRLLEGFAPVAEAFGDAMGRWLTEPDEDTGDRDRKRLRGKGKSEAEKAATAEHMKALKHVRASFKRGSPGLLAAEILEVVHPAVAEVLCSKGAVGMQQALERLGKLAPEFVQELGHRWLELVGVELLRSSMGVETEPLDESCLVVSELAKVLAGETSGDDVEGDQVDDVDGDQADGDGAPASGPQPVA